jgi:hypothetical protein
VPPILNPTLTAILVASSLCAAAFVFLRVRACRISDQQAGWNAVEVSATVLVGALSARLFIWSLLSLQPFGTTGAAFIEWAFLFWPGLIDTASLATTESRFFKPVDLVAWATVFGGLAGFWDGFHRIHNWRRFGGLSFLLDVTWGGAATSIGVVSHFLNLSWGKPIDSLRLGAHRYDAGVCTNRQYAIALGNVCGNLQGRGDGPLFRHESIHVLQNRIFGPFYLFSYLFWMAALLVPALVWGLVFGRPGEVIYAWCYANNPWEEWAYRYGGSRSDHLIWPIRRIIVVSVFIAILAALVLAQIVKESTVVGASSG